MSTIIATLGGPAAVAKMLGIKSPSVSGWGGKPPPERCPAIERATDGRVTVEELRPDLAARWYRVPDPDWPHHKGRPLLDVARSAEPVAAGAEEGSDAG